MIRTYKLVTTVTAGGAGVAASNDRFPEVIEGRLLGINVGLVGGTAPASQDFTVTVTSVDGTDVVTLLSLGNNATPAGMYYPRAQAHDVNGVGLTFDNTEPVPVEIPIGGTYVNVAVAQSDNGVSYNVFLHVER
jgi:hypothetical protein